MPWPNPFRKRNENTCTTWGYTFQVTPQHLTKQDTAAMKMSYDTLGEAAWQRLNVLCPPQQAVSGAHKRDLFILLRDHALEDEVLQELWTEVNEIPCWVCWEQIERGQEVFYRYSGPALTGLAFQSLFGGMVDGHPKRSFLNHADDSLRVRLELSKLFPGPVWHSHISLTASN